MFLIDEWLNFYLYSKTMFFYSINCALDAVALEPDYRHFGFIIDEILFLKV